MRIKELSFGTYSWSTGGEYVALSDASVGEAVTDGAIFDEALIARSALPEASHAFPFPTMLVVACVLAAAVVIAMRVYGDV